MFSRSACKGSETIKPDQGLSRKGVLLGIKSSNKLRGTYVSRCPRNTNNVRRNVLLDPNEDITSNLKLLRYADLVCPDFD